MAEVVLRGVGKVYPGGVRAVAGVDLVIRDREFAVLVGPSGCGKSTTLRIIAGLESASQGEILIDGRRVNDLPAKDRDVAMVFQSYALYPHMTVRQNLAFGLLPRLRHRSRAAALLSPAYRRAARADLAAMGREIDGAARLLGLEGLLERRPRELSGGQRQRVALGRAIVRKPKLFLFDEPLSNLDAKLRLETRGELKSLQRRLATTSIYVTHDQEEAMTLGDLLVVMKDGVVQQIGPPATVYSRPANRFVAGFVGSPPMNFLRGRLVEAGGELWFDDGEQRLRVPAEHRAALHGSSGAELELGLRPDALAPAGAGEAAAGAALKCRLDGIEDLGGHVDLLASTARQPRLRCRTPLHGGAKLHGEILLRADLRRAHFFAPDGAALVF